MTRIYKINTTAILSARQTSAAYASSIIAQHTGAISIDRGYLKASNMADAILKGLCESVDQVSGRLNEGDRLEISIDQRISHLLPRIVAYHNAPVRHDQTASEEMVQRFRSKIISMHLKGVDTSFVETPVGDPSFWRKLKSHCEMTLAMAA